MSKQVEYEDLEICDQDTMLRLPGEQRSFRCDCACNVFRLVRGARNASGRLLPEKHARYVCNSCRQVYTTEPDDTKETT